MPIIWSSYCLRTPFLPGRFEGLVNGAVVLTGPTLSPRLRGEVVLTESKVTLPGLIEKPIGAQATVEFYGMIPQGSGVVAQQD